MSGLASDGFFETTMVISTTESFTANVPVCPANVSNATSFSASVAPNGSTNGFLGAVPSTYMRL